MKERPLEPANFAGVKKRFRTRREATRSCRRIRPENLRFYPSPDGVVFLYQMFA